MSDQTEESFWTDELSNPTWISWLLCLVVLGVSGLCLFSSHFIGAEFLPSVGDSFVMTCIAGMACFYSLTEFIYPIDCERKEAERIFSELPCDIGARIDTSTFVWHRVSEQDMKDTEYQKLTAYPSENARYVKRGLRDVDGNPVSPLARLDGTETILQVVHTPNMLHEEGLTHPTFTQFAQKHAETVVAMEEAQAQAQAQAQAPAPRQNMLGASNSAGGWGSGGPQQLLLQPPQQNGGWGGGGMYHPIPPAARGGKRGRPPGAPNRPTQAAVFIPVHSPGTNITHISAGAVSRGGGGGGRGGGPGSRGGGRGRGRGGASGGGDAGKRKRSESYSAGDEVLARFTSDGGWYGATIVAFMNPDKYVIEWDDGDTTDMVKGEDDLKPVV